MKEGLFVIVLFFFSHSLQAQADTVVIRSIYFGGGSYYVDEEQTGKLYELIDSFKNLSAYQISITSHTDNIGGVEFNEWLSKMRSEAVLDKLILKNIPPDLIHIKDFGQHNPLYDNSQRQGRFKNRRVDIIFSPLLL